MENLTNLPHMKNLRYSFLMLPVSMQLLTQQSVKVIAAEVIVCYLEMLCKWKGARWLSM